MNDGVARTVTLKTGLVRLKGQLPGTDPLADEHRRLLSATCTDLQIVVITWLCSGYFGGCAVIGLAGRSARSRRHLSPG